MFPPQFLDEIRARVSLADTIGRRVRLTRRGREHVGLCPFHNEKTPSFTVSEDKGFFHCFGCGEHGDVIGFVMRTDNLTFPEAVERLAEAAGLPLPRQTPEDKARETERTSLYTVLEAACAWFESQLAETVGAKARDYLTGRGLDAGTIAKFRLGWAPDSRNALKRALSAEGISETMMVAVGLLIVPDDGGASYDRFRGRVIFPITDRGGRIVAFGGRALGDGKPKYLNSPETTLFHKGALVYGHAMARKAAREAREVVVCEGYTDVIALHRAGFENAVAPLGTALTETQIRELWGLAPEPVICFDGDEAGRKAAWRAAERALPLLGPGRSLRFVALPPGDDPDSIIAKRGAKAFRDLVNAAQPLADLLTDMVLAGRPIDTPERRADFEKQLLDFARAIGDSTVRSHYERYFKDRLWDIFRARRTERTGRTGGQRRPGETRRRSFAPVMPEPPMRDWLGSGTDGSSERRERLLVAMVVAHPELLATVEEEFAALEIQDRDLDALRGAILTIAHDDAGLDTAVLKRHLSGQGCATLAEGLSSPADWPERRLADRLAQPGVPLAEIEKGWRHVSARHRRAVTLRTELRAAQEEFAENMTDEAFERIKALGRQIESSAGDEADLDELQLVSEE